MKWRRVVVWLALLLATSFCVLWLFQRRLLFPRPPLSGAPTRPDGVGQIWLLFFHGNGELIDYWPGEFAEPRGWGIGTLLVEFPGYGRSGGSPSQASIEATALAAYDWAASQAFVERSRIVACGRSLGGGAATILASKRPLAALVLESTFTSVRSFAHRFWAPELAARDPFDSLSLLREYAGPVLVLHGARDELIPPVHAERLAGADRRSELHLLPCGHNDCPRSWSRVRDFLVTSGVLAPTLRVEDR